MILRTLSLATLTTASVISLWSFPAHAAEGKKAEESIAAKSTPIPTAEETPVKKWIDAENALIAPLADKDKENFFILRNKYSVIRTIGVVKRDVGTAVKSCGDENPDIKGTMDARFTQWKNAVDPIIKTANRTLDETIKAQTLVDEKKFRNVLKLNDTAFEFSEKQIQKQPITTKEACQGLLDSMDRTEDQMITLLQQTLLPESVIIKRSEAQAKEAAKTAPAETPSEDKKNKEAPAKSDASGKPATP